MHSWLVVVMHSALLSFHFTLLLVRHFTVPSPGYLSFVSCRGWGLGVWGTHGHPIRPERHVTTKSILQHGYRLEVYRVLV